MSDAEGLLLYQFAFSHFNENVRWALDYKGLPRKERAVLPGFHARSIRKLSGGPTTTPLLCDGGRQSRGRRPSSSTWNCERLRLRSFPRTQRSEAKRFDGSRGSTRRSGPLFGSRSFTNSSPIPLMRAEYSRSGNRPGRERCTEACSRAWCRCCVSECRSTSRRRGRPAT